MVRVFGSSAWRCEPPCRCRSARERPGRETGPARPCNAAGIRLGHRHHHAKARNLLDDKQDGIRPGPDQSAGMNQALGDDAIERRSDLQIGLEVLLRLHGALGRGPAGLLPDAHQRLGCLHLLFCLIQLVAGDRAGRFRGLLQPVVAVLCAPASCASACKRSDSAACTLDSASAICAFISGSGQFGEQVALFHDAAAVDEDALDIARALWRAARRSGTAGISPGSSTVLRRRPAPRRGPGPGVWADAQTAITARRHAVENLIALHSIGSPDPWDSATAK